MPPRAPLVVLALIFAGALIGFGISSPSVVAQEASATPEPSSALVTSERLTELAAQKSSIAPVPASALGPQIDYAVGYVVEPVGRDAYWVTNGNEQVVFFVTGEGVILVDAPPDMTEAITSAIAATTDEPVAYLIYSHYHADHISGAAAFGNDVTIIAHELTAAHLERAADPARPLPTVTFSDEYVLQVGSQTLELAYKGANHTAGNIFIWAPEQKLLTLIDVVWPGWVPFTQLGFAEDVPGYMAAIDQALAYPFEIFVGGHVGRYGTRADVEMTRAYVADLQSAAGQALAGVDLFAIAGAAGFDNPWFTLDAYFADLAAACAAIVEPEWTGTLAGADIWTESNCQAVVQSLRID